MSAANEVVPASERQNRPGGRLSRRATAGLLFLLACTTLAYSRSLVAPFVFDDRRLVVENPLVRELAVYFVPGRLDELSATPRQLAAHRERWLSMLTLAVDFRLHGLDPHGYHATNLAIHLFATLMLFDVVRRTLHLPALASSRLAGEAETAALLVAALFALHPIQTQAVTYVVQRMAALAGALCLLALWAHLRARTAESARARAGFAALTTIALAGAMLSKQNAFTFPLVLLVFDRFLWPLDGFRRSLRLLALPLLSMLVVPVQQLRAHGHEDAPFGSAADPSPGESRITHADYLVTQPRVVVTYLRLLALPVGQNLDWEVEPSRSIAEPRVLVSAGVLAALLATGGWLIVSRRRRDFAWSLAGFGVVWFFALLAVESGLVPIHDLLFEHRLYLPSAGLFLAVVVALLLVAPPESRRLAVAAAFAAVLVLGSATFARNEVWRDELRLWSDALSKSPTKVRVLSNTATALVERGRYAEAEVLFRRALERDPGNRAALRSLGSLARARRASAEAESYYRRALAAGERDWVSLLNLGDLAFERRDLSEARSYYERAAAFEPEGRLSRARLALVASGYDKAPDLRPVTGPSE